ncbi:hypothetical protein [Fibrella forsythiae]|uniref:Uncharacterized protein n=1 Tax=Fibrella forsythiae TaxID=2817061 RepID=A0ABS3JBZ6_9BACT|nr:hypothetical protein [Fibrella forsythiae]MBO0947508.1 hypothetical protein [Fibrella forsythiae]
MTESELIAAIREKKKEIDRFGLEQLYELDLNLRAISQLLLDLSVLVGSKTEKGLHYEFVEGRLWSTIDKEASRLVTDYKESNKPRASAISKRRLPDQLTSLKQRISSDLSMIDRA